MLSNINSQGHVYVFHILKLLIKQKHKSDFQSFGERGFKPDEMHRETAFLQFSHHLGHQPLPSTKEDDPMHHALLEFLPMSFPGSILPCTNYKVFPAEIT